MPKKFKKGETLTLLEGLPDALKIETFGDGLRIIFVYHAGSPFVVTKVLDDRHARDLLDWLRAQGFGRKTTREKRATSPPGTKPPRKKCYRGRVCGSVPCECGDA